MVERLPEKQSVICSIHIVDTDGLVFSLMAETLYCGYKTVGSNPTSRLTGNSIEFNRSEYMFDNRVYV